MAPTAAAGPSRPAPGARGNSAAPRRREGCGVAKRVIAARSADAKRESFFFLGYRDDPLRSFPRWTRDRFRARWLDADEAEVEVALLALQCLSHRIVSEPLDAAPVRPPGRRSRG
jgi:hypothetical protein